MAEQPIPLEIAPGVLLTEAPLSAKGRYVDASWVRFWRGRAQLVGGYKSLIGADARMLGVPRGAKGWSDTASRQLVGVGTNIKLYVTSDVDFKPIDITPWRVSTANLVDPISSVNGSDIVTVQYVAHGATVDSYVDIAGANVANGLDPNGSWKITEIVDADNVRFQHTAQATGTGAFGGAAVTVGFEIAPGLTDPAAGYGWGAGTWGQGTWDTPRSYTTLSFSPIVWSFGSFGKILIACRSQGELFSYDPTAFPQARAQKIPNGPSFCTGVMVTSDNIVVAYGTDFDPDTLAAGGPAKQDLLQYWASAQGDYLNWDATVNYGPNGSPSIVNRLNEGTRIVAGADLGVHVSLLWTDTAVYSLQYTGTRFVFNTSLGGKECGLLGPQAFAVNGTQAYWVGPHGFFMFNGGVSRIPNSDSVSEWVINNLRPYYAVKTTAWYNQRYNEVWFLFVSQDETEPTYYVCVSLADWSWTKGIWPEAVSAATRFTSYDARPIVAGANGDLYQTDSGSDANGADISWFLQTSPLELANGAQMIELSGLAIDMQRQSSPIVVKMEAYDRTPAGAVPIDTLTTAFAPGENVMDARVAGRSIALRFSGTGKTQDFRMGVLKGLTGAGGSRR